MSSRSDVLKMVDELISTLSGPLTEDDIRGGWTEASRVAMLKFFTDLKTKLQSHEELPRGLNIPRGMDSWGVVNGRLLRQGAKLSNALYESGLVEK